MNGRLSFLVAALAFLGPLALTSDPAQAGKVHWKQDPAAPSCYALAFDDTNQWFATPQGFAFKRGVCFGQRVRYKVELAPDGETFTASGANSCTYRVGEAHAISVACGPSKPK